MIIGIAGRAQCGKDTLAQSMSQTMWMHRRSPCTILPFAQALRDVVAAAFGSRYETQEQKEAVDTWWGERLGGWENGYGRETLGEHGPAQVTGRRILQFVGTELFRRHVHTDFWLFALEMRLPKDPDEPVIIPDVRFDNEAQWILDHHGLVIELVRKDQINTPRSTHASEHGVTPKLVIEKHCSASADETAALGVYLANRFFVPTT